MRTGLAVLAIALTGACSLRPVYSPAGLQAGSDAVSVSEIPGRSGYFLRRALRRELAAGLPGVDDASLSVDLKERLSRINIQPDAASSRTDIRAEGRYVLELSEDAITGRIVSESSFNVPTAPFADVSAQIDASERAMDVLARRIVDDIRLQLADRAQDS